MMALSSVLTATAGGNSRASSEESDSDSSNIGGSLSNNIELYRLVLTRDWDRVIQRLREYPEEAKFLDDFGLSPLHRACFRDAPVHVVEALVEAFPEATTMQDRCNFSGLTPLHAACHYCSVSVVRCLLRSNPSTIHMLSTKGHTPLQCTCQVYEARLRHHFSRVEFETNSNQRNKKSTGANNTPTKPWSDLFVEDPILLRFWGVVCSLLQVQVYGAEALTEKDDGSAFIVHASAEASPTVPMILVELAVKLYPEQLLLPCKRRHELPLHIALTQPSPTPSSDALASFLFQQNPTAASHRDANGNYPFVLAKGKSWKTFVYPLLHAHPAAFCALKPTDQSFATILGKVATTNSPLSQKLCNRLRRINEDEDAALVSTLFGLLREHPALMDLSSCCTGANRHAASSRKSRVLSYSSKSSKRFSFCTLISYVEVMCNLRGGRMLSSKNNDNKSKKESCCTQPPSNSESADRTIVKVLL